MTTQVDWGMQIALEAELKFGRMSRVWMVRSNRRLTHLTPAGLMVTPAGARVVLFDMRRVPERTAALAPRNVEF
jgi:Protein of unknown function (DUF2384)